VDATLLAMAGLNRLGLADRATSVLSEDQMLPAVAQGAIGIETRRGDDRTNAYVRHLNCATTEARVTAERGVLATLDGSCRTPIAALALINGEALSLKALVVRPDGRQWFTCGRAGYVSDAQALGVDAGLDLKARLPAAFFAGMNPDGPVV
jgi:hydroxymethylbilane synthase